jgi:CBS domain-containing protein
MPLINKEGKYEGSISEGDILWFVKNNNVKTLRDSESINIGVVPKYRQYKSMGIDYEMEDLIQLSIAQNFVPIVDSDGIFIGIVTRKDIINYLYNKVKEKE